jgi:hypothetical protein
MCSEAIIHLFSDHDWAAKTMFANSLCYCKLQLVWYTCLKGGAQYYIYSIIQILKYKKNYVLKNFGRKETFKIKFKKIQQSLVSQKMFNNSTRTSYPVCPVVNVLPCHDTFLTTESAYAVV